MDAESRSLKLVEGSFVLPAVVTVVTLALAITLYNMGQRANSGLDSQMPPSAMALFVAAAFLEGCVALGLGWLHARIRFGTVRSRPQRILWGALALWCLIGGAGLTAFWTLLSTEESGTIVTIIGPLAILLFGLYSLRRFFDAARPATVPVAA